MPALMASAMMITMKSTSFVIDSSSVSMVMPSTFKTDAVSPTMRWNTLPMPCTATMVIYVAMMILMASFRPMMKLYVMTMAKKTMMNRSQVSVMFMGFIIARLHKMTNDTTTNDQDGLYVWSLVYGHWSLS